MLTARQTTDHRPVVVLVGPTAIGKSQVAIEVAKSLETEILTADSRQVYRGMDVGTDKPTITERQGIPHRLIDLVDPDQPFNVGDYRRAAGKEIDRLHSKGQIPLMAGGTGLYIRAVLHGLWDGPSADWNYRLQLDGEAKVQEPGYLHKKLLSIDPEAAARLHPHDHVKIQRALEVYHLSGVPISKAHARHAFQEEPYRALTIGLTMDRPSLYARIDDRVELELAKGLLQETNELMKRGYSRELGSMKSLGYRQMAGYLQGEYSYEEAVRQLKRDTRHFAKRQITWFRKDPSIHWLEVQTTDALSETANRIMKVIHQYVRELKGITPTLQSPHLSISTTSKVRQPTRDFSASSIYGDETPG